MSQPSPASSPDLPLLSYLNTLTLDPASFAAFERDPDAALDETSLTGGQKAAIKTRDPDVIREAIIEEIRTIRSVNPDALIPFVYVFGTPVIIVIVKQ